MKKTVKPQYPNGNANSFGEQPISVLCVDDEADFLNSTKQLLEIQRGFIVEVASSVNEALQKMRNKTFDVVVSDYMMPEKNGLDFLKELRENDNNIPFILFTGKGREEVAVKALNLGACRYFNKFGHPETVYAELAHGIRQAAAQKRAEQEIWNREERLRAIFASSPDAMIVTDLQRKITNCNLETLKLLGFSSKADIIGKKASMLPITGDQEKVRAAIKRLGEQGLINNIECSVLTKNGREVPVEFSANVLKDTHGNAVGAVVLARNITDRKKAEESLRNSEENYRNIVELSPDGIVSMDANGIITSVNKAILDKTGFSESEFLGKQFTQLKAIQAENLSDYSKVVDSFLRGDVPDSFELPYFRKDGAQRLAEVRVGLLTRNGKPFGLQLIFRDITERKQIEQNLKESEEKYRAVVEQAPDSIITFDLDGIVTSCNIASLAFTGFSEESVIGKHFSELLSQLKHVNSKQIFKMFKSLVEGKVPEPFEVTYLNKNGDPAFGEVHAGFLKEKGTITGFQAVMRDITKYKKAEETLRKSEQHFRELSELLPEIVFELDTQGIVRFVNHETYTRFGYSRKEFDKGLIAVELLAPEDRDRAKKHIEKVLHGEETGSSEYTAMKKDGSKFPITVHTTPIIRDDKVVGLRGLMVDITERKKTEDTLKESEEKFRTLAEQSPNMIFINQNGKVVYVNPKCEELMGYTKKEFYSSKFNFLDLIAPESVELVKSNFIKHINGEEIPPYEYAVITKKGKQLDTIITSKLITYNGQKAILGTITDITKRKKAEEALQRERELLEHITEKMGAVLAVISPEFRVLWGNNVLHKMHDKLEGQICYKLFSKRNSVCPGCGVKEIFDTGKDLVIHQQAVPGPDGQPHWLELFATPVRDKNGKITAVLELVVDINERKESEEKIDEMMKKLVVTNEKMDVVGKLTRHDARNKLAVITNNIYLAKQQLTENHETSEYLDTIESAAEQIESIFDFAGIYEKVGKEELTYVDVQKNIDEAIMLLSCPEDKKVVNECEGLSVLADSLLRQIFYNLLDNSLKYGEQVTQIRFYYKKLRYRLKLFYEDDGYGIPDNEKEKIFEEGYGKGTGYGLYLIQKTCEAYGWSIKETGVPGKGAQFTITIPKTSKNGKTFYKTS